MSGGGEARADEECPQRFDREGNVRKGVQVRSRERAGVWKCWGRPEPACRWRKKPMESERWKLWKKGEEHGERGAWRPREGGESSRQEEEGPCGEEGLLLP